LKSEKIYPGAQKVSIFRLQAGCGKHLPKKPNSGTGNCAFGGFGLRNQYKESEDRIRQGKNQIYTSQKLDFGHF